MASKQHERFYCDILLERVPGLELIEPDREEPDFLLRDSAGPIGLELRQVFRREGLRGSKERAREVQRNQLLREIAEAYYSHGDAVPISLTMHTRRGGVEPPADAAVSAIRECLATSCDERVEVEINGTNLHVWRLRDDEEFAGYRRGWDSVNNASGIVTWLRAEELQRIIDEKAQRLPAYRESVERVSLLLFAERNRVSAFCELDLTAGDLDARGFEKVYFLMHPGELTMIAAGPGSDGCASGLD